MLGTLLLLLPMAAGALVMHLGGAPLSRWGAHLAVGTVGALLFLALTRGGKLPARVVPWLAFVALGIVAATLAGSADIDGVQRWVVLGAFRIHPSALLGPALLVFVATRLEETPWRAHAVLLAMAGLHIAQPDAGQATSFGLAAVSLTALFDRPRLLLVPVYLAAIGLGWLRPDPLEPAPFVEDIVARAFASSTLLGVVAIVTAALAVLAPRALLRGGDRSGAARRVELALTSYFATSLLVPVLGEFPVPLLGFGSSPALGAFLGIASMHRACRLYERAPVDDRDDAKPPNQSARVATAS